MALNHRKKFIGDFRCVANEIENNINIRKVRMTVSR